MRMFSKEEIMAVIQTFVELTLSGGLNDQLLQNLNVALTILLNSNFVTEDTTMTVNICVYLLDYIRKEGLDTEKILQCKPLLLLVQTILSCNCTNAKNIFEVIQKHFDIVDYMINLVTGKMKTFTLQQDSVLYITW
jgi:septum formation topological specificity factor MinE